MMTYKGVLYIFYQIFHCIRSNTDNLNFVTFKYVYNHEVVRSEMLHRDWPTTTSGRNWTCREWCITCEPWWLYMLFVCLSFCSFSHQSHQFCRNDLHQITWTMLYLFKLHRVPNLYGHFLWKIKLEAETMRNRTPKNAEMKDCAHACRYMYLNAITFI